MKKILITLPDEMLTEVDTEVLEEATNRSKFIRTAIRSYLKSSKEERIREKLKKGYLNMAQVNLSIANMCISADSEQLEVYEEKLAESEK